MQTNQPDNLDLFGYTPEETLSVEQLQDQLQQPSKSGVTAAPKETKNQNRCFYGVTGVTGVTPSNDAASSCYTNKNSGVTGVTAPQSQEPKPAETQQSSNSLVTVVTVVTPSNDAASSCNQIKKELVTLVTPEPKQTKTQQSSKSGVTGVTAPQNQEPLLTELKEPKIFRPSFVTHDYWFKIGNEKFKAGLYFHGETEGTEDKEPLPINDRVSSPIHCIAVSSDKDGGEFGRLLRFIDTHGKFREWVMPVRLLKGNGEEVRGELLNMGWLPHSNKLKTRDRFNEWLLQTIPEQRVTAVTSTGWHDDGIGGKAFVFPNETLGSKKIRYQSEYARNSLFHTKGTIESWRDNVAMSCKGNPLLMLSLSCALAGTLLLPAKGQSAGGGGINLMGKSSKGKTTAQYVASSVWGSRDFVRTWTSTGNGLEATAASLNDTLLILDELGQSDPRTIGDIVYLIGNGSGKQRANQGGGSRKIQKWRLMTISSGEKSLTSHMEEAGKKTKAGQQVRLLDIPATEQRHGLFDELHGCKDGGEFARKLNASTQESYGVAGQFFIKKIMQIEDLPEQYKATKDNAAFATEDALEGRAAETFAVIALAGELATRMGLTGWNEGESTAAAATCFNLWRSARTQGNTEDNGILESISSYIETYSDSHFTSITAPLDHAKVKRSGYFEEIRGGRVYYFTTAGFKEAIAGYEVRTANQALEVHGWLYEKRDDGKTSVNRRINGKQVRLTAVLPKEL